MIHVGHKIIYEKSSPNKKKILLTFAEIVENWTPVTTIGLLLQIHKHKMNTYFACLFFICWNFLKIKFEAIQPCFFK